MIRVFLCDDDPSYLEYLSGIVGQFFQQNKIEAGIKTFLDGETLLEEPEMADLVFLDVEMPEKSGIEIGKCIKEKNPYALIFIVSFTERYLDDAMDFHVFRYIEKSTLSDRIMRNLSDALVAYKNTNPKITITQWRDYRLSGSRYCHDREPKALCSHIYDESQVCSKGKTGGLGAKAESDSVLQIAYEFSSESGLCEPVYEE